MGCFTFFSQDFFLIIRKVTGTHLFFEKKLVKPIKLAAPSCPAIAAAKIFRKRLSVFTQWTCVFSLLKSLFEKNKVGVEVRR